MAAHQAKNSISTLVVAVVVAAALLEMVGGVSAQLAPAPAPGMDAGAAFSLPVSGAFLGLSLLVSLLGLFKH